MCLKISVSIEVHYRYKNYNGEPRDIPNIYLIRIFLAIWLNDNWHYVIIMK
jgi:hypothetical protein